MTDGHAYRTLKFVMLGDSGVGKSCLLTRLTLGEMDTAIPATTGAAFMSYRLATETGTHVLLHLWDTAGQEQYRSLSRQHFRGAHGALLVYDKTRKDTFDDISSWLRDLRDIVSTPITLLLVGNKADLAETEEVTVEEGALFARTNGLLFIETSASTGKNVVDAFTQVATNIIRTLTNSDTPIGESDGDEFDGDDFIVIDHPAPPGAKCAC